MFKESKYNIITKINGEDVMYNSISKSFLRVFDGFNIDDIIKSINKNSNVSEEIKPLIDNGFIVDENSIEVDNLEFLFNRNFFNNSQLNIILMPTLKCNFDCPYCFEKSYRNMKSNKNYFDILGLYSKKYFKYYKHVEISLFGGEPLLLSDKIWNYFNKVQELSENNNFTYSSSITTNGSLITNEIINNLIKYKCKSLQITLDGSKRTHNLTRCYRGGEPTFDKLIDIINNVVGVKILESNLNFILRVNLNNNFIDEIVDTLDLIEKRIRNKVSLVLRPIYNTNSYNCYNNNKFEEINKYYKIAKEMGFKVMKNRYYYRSCEACGDENFFYIAPDLSLWKCVNNFDIKEANIGFIDNLGDININAERLLKWYKASDCFRDNKCLKCKKLPDCLGGCILFNVKNGIRKCSPFELVSLPYYYD